VKTIPALKQEMIEKQTAANHRAFDAHAESAKIELDFGEAEASVISQAQMGKLRAMQRQDFVREARDAAKAEYLAAEVEYAEKQAKRILSCSLRRSCRHE
jgi:hypothetical protein